MLERHMYRKAIWASLILVAGIGALATGYVPYAARYNWLLLRSIISPPQILLTDNFVGQAELQNGKLQLFSKAEGYKGGVRTPFYMCSGPVYRVVVAVRNLSRRPVEVEFPYLEWNVGNAWSGIPDTKTTLLAGERKTKDYLFRPPRNNVYWLFFVRSWGPTELVVEEARVFQEGRFLFDLSTSYSQLRARAEPTGVMEPGTPWDKLKAFLKIT